MESSDIHQFWDPKSPSYQSIHDPIGGLSTFDPFNLLPDPLLSEITTPPSTESTEFSSSSLTWEGTAHVEELPFFGLYSPVLALDALSSHLDTTEMAPALDPGLIQPSYRHSTSSVSPLPVNPSPSSPTTANAAPSAPPLAHKLFYSTANPENQSPNPTPGPSALRPAKRSRTSYPGESSFRLDSTVATRPSSKPADQPMGKASSRSGYSACQCPARLTSNRARHWRSCPDNPEASVKRFTCEICGTKFTREDNKKRHVEDRHS